MTDTVTRLMQLAEHWADCSYQAGCWNVLPRGEDQYRLFTAKSDEAKKVLREAIERELNFLESGWGNM